MALGVRASARIFWVLLTDTSLLLDFLEPGDVLNALHASHERLLGQPRVLYQWLHARLQGHWPTLPPTPPDAYLQPRVLLLLLEQLHIIDTFAFNLTFDPERRGNKIRVMHAGSVCRTAMHGTVLGHRSCLPDTVSYWECEGITMGCYVGIALALEDTEFLQRHGFHLGEDPSRRPEVLFSRKALACDLLPAIMYGQTGEITTGEFRGPRLPLPARMRAIAATPISPDDIIGIAVDLSQGQLLFFHNGHLQARIPLDRRRQYTPIFSCRTTTPGLFIRKNSQPPWSLIFDHATFREEAEYLAAQSRQKALARARGDQQLASAW